MSEVAKEELVQESAPSVGESYLGEARSRFRYYRWLAERALEQVDDRQFFHTDSSDTNPVAVIVKHLAGNMLSRFMDFGHSDGEKPDRNRDGEFELYEGDTRSRLEQRLQQGWDLVESTVDGLAVEDLTETVYIRSQPHTALEAINRQLTHYAYHVGQIVTLCRKARGERWESLSIPRGQSNSFNQSMLPKPTKSE
jgi:hypothetical protein